MSTLGQRMGLVVDRPSSKCIGPEGCVGAMTELQAENERLARERDEAVELVVQAHRLIDDFGGEAAHWLDRAAPIVGEAT